MQKEQQGQLICSVTPLMKGDMLPAGDQQKNFDFFIGQFILLLTFSFASETYPELFSCSLQCFSYFTLSNVLLK